MIFPRERDTILENRPRDVQRVQEPATARRLHILSFSCCDGIASVVLAWSDLPVMVTSAISATDPEALAVSGHRCKDALFIGDVRGLSQDVISTFINTYEPDVIFASAGTPCKQVSRAAEDQSGLGGSDSNSFWSFRAALVVSSQAASQAGIPFYWLWENVIIKEEWLLQAEAALGRQAVVIDAAYFGHHRRPRIWIFNWDLSGWAARWLRKSASGRTEVRIPLSARRLQDLGQIFRSSFFPRRLRSAGTHEFPEGKFPCLTCPHAARYGALGSRQGFTGGH